MRSIGRGCIRFGEAAKGNKKQIQQTLDDADHAQACWKEVARRDYEAPRWLNQCHQQEQHYSRLRDQQQRHWDRINLNRSLYRDT